MFGASWKYSLGRKFNVKWSIMHTYHTILTIWESAPIMPYLLYLPCLPYLPYGTERANILHMMQAVRMFVHSWKYSLGRKFNVKWSIMHTYHTIPYLPYGSQLTLCILTIPYHTYHMGIHYAYLLTILTYHMRMCPYGRRPTTEDRCENHFDLWYI